ncbi:hypothetical protein VTN77DRAFT_1750 [Rasamsonia byssochlamydoides]|uniref:uncharacterized protein n=1 Tax=Rasamsonia byssochlamydoides TaxID=89139 RepID=UPI0037435830
MLNALQAATYGVATSFYIVGTASICLRIYSRWFIVKSYKWDDWFMTSILFFSAGQQAILYIFLSHGAGLPISAISTENLLMIFRVIFAESIYYCIFTDLVILSLPIRPLWSIQASVRRRIGLICIITLGGCSPLVSLVRLVTLVQFGSSPDFTYPLAKLLLVSAIEIQVAIMAANAPSLKAIWRKHIVKSLGSEYPSSHARSHELSAMSSNKRKMAKSAPSGSLSRNDGESRAHKLAADADAPSDDWRNDSEEQLFQKEPGITVTSSRRFNVTN